MASGDIRNIIVRRKVSKEDLGFFSDVNVVTGIDISLFTIAGVVKSQFTGNEIGEFVITLVEI